MSEVDSTQALWTRTPLILSRQLSGQLGCKVYLKLENLQPSQSFKYRGISWTIQNHLKKHGSSLHLYIASGGNAGLACACVAKNLGLQCSVYVPEGVGASTINELITEGAQVVVRGQQFKDAAELAASAASSDPSGVLIHPYDDENLWLGHASIVHEISEQLQCKPRAMFCSVGGGGLLGGVLIGANQVGWSDVTIVALETHGSACFYETMMLNRSSQDRGTEGVTDFGSPHGQGPILASIIPRSRAASLGASSPAAGVVSLAMQRNTYLRCVTVPDECSMETAISFSQDHKFLVELACATALTPAYNKQLLRYIIPNLSNVDSIVFIVCGGTKSSAEEIEEYKGFVSALEMPCWDVHCDGSSVEIQRGST